MKIIGAGIGRTGMVIGCHLVRRGLAPAIHCRACGVSRRCGLCDVALIVYGCVAQLNLLAVAVEHGRLVVDWGEDDGLYVGGSAAAVAERSLTSPTATGTTPMQWLTRQRVGGAGPGIRPPWAGCWRSISAITSGVAVAVSARIVGDPNARIPESASR